MAQMGKQKPASSGLRRCRGRGGQGWHARGEVLEVHDLEVGGVDVQRRQVAAIFLQTQSILLKKIKILLSVDIFQKVHPRMGFAACRKEALTIAGKFRSA